MPDNNSVIPPVVLPASVPWNDIPEDSPAWARVINDNLYEQSIALNAILETMRSTAASIDGIYSQVEPLVDSLSNSPIFKMMGGGRK